MQLFPSDKYLFPEGKDTYQMERVNNFFKNFDMLLMNLKNASSQFFWKFLIRYFARKCV